MVAISLYRGNLHRAPDIPRRWLMPTPKISLKDFKSLLNRRNKALSRFRSSSSSSVPSPSPSPSPNPNPNPNPNPDSQPPLIVSPEQNAPPIEPKVEEQVEPELPRDLNTGPPPTVVVKVDVGGASDGVNLSVKLDEEQPEKDENEKDANENEKDANENEKDASMQVEEKPPEETKASLEESDKVNELNEKVKRKRDVEEKLHVLIAKKHNLVQVLKQLLNAEEELKRRNIAQGMGIRPSVPLQVETTNDSVSMTRLATPRMGSEANLAGENEGVEGDDVSNHNIHSRHVFRMSSTSPSSESPLRRPAYFQHNVVPHPSRATMGITGSPSRFAPIGNQGHPGNPPAISVSGTNYIASSPSPAASGGTSVFRESRQPSPWN